jgi:hypothetical protein
MVVARLYRDFLGAHASGVALYFLGSTGCQPVVGGSPAGNVFDHVILRSRQFPVSASCRDLQAGSLRSPARAVRRAALAADGLVMAEAAFPHVVCPGPREQQPASLNREGLYKVRPF